MPHLPAPERSHAQVVKTDETDPAIFERAMAFTRSLAKTPVECIDTPGFVVNRLLVPYICSALLLVERGVASPADVRRATNSTMPYLSASP